jgi:hypothetical protein
MFTNDMPGFFWNNVLNISVQSNYDDSIIEGYFYNASDKTVRLLSESDTSELPRFEFNPEVILSIENPDSFVI